MRDFDRYGPAIVFFHIGAAMIAASFGAVVLKNGTPVTPELYGAAVYAVPALVWVAIQLSSTIMAAIGAAIGGKSGAWVCMFGAAVAGLLFAALAVMGTNAGATGTLVVSGCAFVMSPLSMASFLICVGYLRGSDE